ncbi:MAG: hypothetical protein H0X37_01975 [Herpetosiphonaceae bacterium]|nr:hypothetical protein [Herpetosiphonaceae bacterium]
MRDADTNPQPEVVQPDEPFANVPVFGALPNDEQAAALQEHGGGLPAQPLTLGLNLNPFASRPYTTQEAVVGYLPSDTVGDDVAIIHASTLSGDAALAGKQLTVSLDRFYVQEYPGLGTHQLLCTFTVGYLAKFDGQTGQPVKQDVTFGYAFPVVDGQAAAVSGMPIFRDLRISDGLYLWISCINTSSSSDDALIQAMTSDAFGKGLQLIAATNVVSGVVSSLVTGIAKHFLSKSTGALTFKPLLGLQIAGDAASGKLREGSYIIAQADADSLKWTDYRWRKPEGRVVDVASGKELPFNYLVIGIHHQTVA